MRMGRTHPMKVMTIKCVCGQKLHIACKLRSDTAIVAGAQGWRMISKTAVLCPSCVTATDAMRKFNIEHASGPV
jgi:hypothetical protein